MVFTTLVARQRDAAVLRSLRLDFRKRLKFVIPIVLRCDLELFIERDLNFVVAMRIESGNVR
jgi:hypothetical protein